jgi:hypothetical protein
MIIITTIFTERQDKSNFSPENRIFFKKIFWDKSVFIQKKSENIEIFVSSNHQCLPPRFLFTFYFVSRYQNPLSIHRSI